MNKKIKSRKDIVYEINVIFKTGSDEDVVSRINSYINTISGKEMIDSSEIKELILHKIIADVYDGKRSLLDYPILKEHFPVLKGQVYLNNYIDRINEEYSKYYPSTKKHLLTGQNKDFYYAFLLDIVNTLPEFETIKNANTNFIKKSSEAAKKSKTYKDLAALLKKNSDIAKLLNTFSRLFRQNLFVDLIIKKIIPLNSIFIYYNINKDIKENTEHFYVLLKKKIPRNTIQTAIHDNLEKIRKGNFKVPDL